MRVVDEPIQDCVTKRRVADEVMPVFHGDLAGDERRPTADPILYEFEQIASFAVAQWRQALVVELCGADSYVERPAWNRAQRPSWSPRTPHNGGVRVGAASL